MAKKKSWWRRVLVMLVAIGIGGYAAMCVGCYSMQDKMLFHPQAVNESQTKLNASSAHAVQLDDIKLHGWKVSPGEKNLIIYYGGNAEQVSYLVSSFEKYQGFTTLLLNFRGYGDNEGKPSEKTLFKDALAVYDQVAGDYDKVFLVGRSLGSGVAVYVASERQVDGVVLVTPYDSIVRVGQKAFPWLPIGIIAKNRFESWKYAPQCSVPALFVVAGRDQVIGNAHSVSLYELWAGEKTWKLLPNDDHNSISVSPSDRPEIEAFLKLHGNP